MKNEKMIYAIGSLPDPDLMMPSKITDPPGSGIYYSARTVVKLLADKDKSLATHKQTFAEYCKEHECRIDCRPKKTDD
jgi:hypothetical protein